MPAQQIPVGKDLYVFTDLPAGTGAATNPNAVIDSHGFRPPSKPNFVVPTVNRHAFLCVEEKRKTGYGGLVYHYVDSVDDITHRRVAAVETIAGGQACPDYLLSKQVQDHKGGGAGRYSETSYADVLAFTERMASGTGFDVISVRNRAARLVYLSTAVDALLKNGYAYREIHCSFCRGGTLDAMKDLFNRGRNERAGGTRA